MTPLSAMEDLWPALLALPLGAAYLAYLIPSWVKRIGLLSCVLNAVVTLLLASTIHTDGVQLHAVGGWAAPLGIMLRVDGLAAVMLLTTALVTLAAGVYAGSYFRLGGHQNQERGFWPLWLFLLAALNLLFVAADLFNLYVTLELMSIAAVALVAMGGGRTSLIAALRYLLVGLIGSLCYLLGVGLIYAMSGSVDLLQPTDTLLSGPAFGIALALMSAGLLFKAGLFPFHFWLPPAHANAPAPVSAMLSALVVEAAFYILLRLWFELAPAGTLYTAQYLPGVLGVVAVFWGGLNALRATRLKMMIAYSTVSQLGYLFLAIPLMVKVGLAAWSGAALLVLAHALAKGAMFLAAGTVLVVAGHDRIADLAGTARRLPLTMLSFALAGVSLIGLPPSGGFLAKWLLFNAAIYTEQWWAVLVLLLGSLLAAAYIFKVIASAFVQHDSTKRIGADAAAGLEWPAFVLALLAILLGFFASAFTELLTIGSPVVGPLLNERSP